MGEHSCQGIHRRRHSGLPRRDPTSLTSSCPGRAELHPAGPDPLWSLTSPAAHRRRWLDLAVILDAFSRRSWAGRWLTTCAGELVRDALDLATAQGTPTAGLVHHTDHGRQPPSSAFGRRRPAADPVASTGTGADPLDNAVAESCFATLERQLPDRTAGRPCRAADGGLRPHRDPQQPPTPPDPGDHSPATYEHHHRSAAPPAQPTCPPERGNSRFAETRVNVGVGKAFVLVGVTGIEPVTSAV